jgi:hypothetical protein
MKRLLLYLLFVVICWPLFAQDCAKKAEELYTAKAYSEVIKVLDQCQNSIKLDSALIFIRGMSLIKLEKFEEARLAFQSALDQNFQPANRPKLNLAKCYAQLDEWEHSIKLIEEMTNQGFGQFQLLDDPLFNPIKEHDNFQKLKEQARSNAYPCLKNINDRKFDFWIGEWDVYANGNQVGESEIRRADGGCAIHENYTTKFNYSGQSINYFDPIDKKWKQYWIGSAGDKTEYIETENYNANMQFIGKTMLKNGKIRLTKMTFTYNADKDTVRQQLESSLDDGQTWTTGFDGLYIRKKLRIEN